MLTSSSHEIIAIFLSNDFLIRYAKAIAKESARVNVKVLMTHNAEDFNGLLGEAEIIDISEHVLHSTEPRMMDVIGSVVRSEYDVGMLLICDHGDSLVLSREGNVPNAIISSGTILDFFINKMVEMVLMESKVESDRGSTGGQRSARSPKRGRQA